MGSRARSQKDAAGADRPRYLHTRSPTVSLPVRLNLTEREGHCSTSGRRLAIATPENVFPRAKGRQALGAVPLALFALASIRPHRKDASSPSARILANGETRGKPTEQYPRCT